MSNVGEAYPNSAKRPGRFPKNWLHFIKQERSQIMCLWLPMRHTIFPASKQDEIPPTIWVHFKLLFTAGIKSWW